MTTVAPDSLKSQYDAKIDACFAEIIRRLREARNADCSKTRKLPSEVLAMIFGILAGDENEIKSYWTLPGWMGWVVVTHVCRTWRSTALSEPTLWTDFSHWSWTSRQWLEEFFRRSKAAPLSLSLRCRPSGFQQHIFEQMLLFPERIKSLDIYNNKEFIPALTKPMLYLETLTVTHPAIFPPNFASGSTPRLRSLALDDAVMPLHASWYSNVRTLSLYGRWSPDDKALSVKSFLQFLSRLPRLVHLTVSLPTDMDTTILPSPGDVTQLSLESWVVYNSRDPIAFQKILQYIEAHTLQCLQACDVADSAILDTIDFYMTNNTRAQFDTVQWKGNEIALVVSANEAIRLSFSFSPYLCYLPPSLASYLSDINIRTLQLLKFCQWSSHFLPIQGCQTVEELRIDADNMFDELMTVKPSPLLYPSLRHLHLRTLSLKPAAQNIPRLIQWIDNRKSIFGLEKLTIENCGLDASEISMLSKKIPVDVVSLGAPT